MPGKRVFLLCFFIVAQETAQANFICQVIEQVLHVPDFICGNKTPIMKLGISQ